MSTIRVKNQASAPGTPSTGETRVYVDTTNKKLASKDDAGVVTNYGEGYSDEQAQDAIGGILVDTATVDFTYDDATPQITADVIDDSITDAKLRNSAGFSVVGKATTGAGDPADIVAGTDSVLSRSGSGDLAFNARAGIDTTAIHTNVAAEINGITEKTTPVAADLVVIEDSAASNAKKKVQLGNVLKIRPFSRGGTVLDPSGAREVTVWRVPTGIAGTVTNVRAKRKGGTGATINARRNGSSNHLASALSLTSADTWFDGGSVQNTAYVAGDWLEIMIVSITGSVTEIIIQVDFTPA